MLKNNLCFVVRPFLILSLYLKKSLNKCYMFNVRQNQPETVDFKLEGFPTREDVVRFPASP